MIDWRGPLVVSAVHAVDHMREGGWKNADSGTGGLAMALGEIVGCSTIAVTRSVPMMGDVNWDGHHPLKGRLEELGHIDESTVFIDLHGMKDGNGADVIIGTGAGSPPSVALANRLAAHLRAAGIATDSDGAGRGFGATRATTMTSWAQRLGASAIQIEISRSHRAAQSPEKLKQRLIVGLVTALRDEHARLASATIGTPLDSSTCRDLRHQALTQLALQELAGRVARQGIGRDQDP